MRFNEDSPSGAYYDYRPGEPVRLKVDVAIEIRAKAQLLAVANDLRKLADWLETQQGSFSE